MSWLTRSDLARAMATAPASAGWLVSGVPGEGFVSLSTEAASVLRRRSAAVLTAAGVSAGRRVLVSLNSDGDLAGARLGEAIVETGASAAVVGPRGRMRTLATMRTLRPDVWVATPTGALDFLARLYLEFNVDPVELELGQILVVGEIPSPGTERRLADEFEAQVTNLYCDPIFSAVWAHGSDGRWSTIGSEGLALAELESDTRVAPATATAISAATAGSTGSGGKGGGLSEIVICPDWPGPFSGQTIRTGQLLGRGSSFFSNTIGDHVLVRGRWLSIPLLRQALARIDGIAGWCVTVSRGEGTLDKLTIQLAYERPSLVENPMWTGRAREAIAAVTPVEFALETELAGEGVAREAVVDRRGHHLGLDRGQLASDGSGRSDG